MPSIHERILFEDNHLIVMNKLATELVQGDETGDLCLLDQVRAYIRITYQKPGNVFTGLVHRIDRPVSGAVVFAKTGKALARMNKLVRDRQLDKTYLAIVKKPPAEQKGILEHHLVKNAKQNKSYLCQPDHKQAKSARLSYEVMGQSERFFLIRIKLYTGRHHQIRAQLAAIGCPIKGDLKYGYDRPNHDGSISLHAWKVAFEHPVQKTMMEITAPTPAENPWPLFRVLVTNESSQK